MIQRTSWEDVEGLTILKTKNHFDEMFIFFTDGSFLLIKAEYTMGYYDEVENCYIDVRTSDYTKEAEKLIKNF